MQQTNIFTGKKRSLRIEPAGTDLVDLIIITWVYEQQKNTDLQNAAVAGSSAVSGSAAAAAAAGS